MISFNLKKILFILLFVGEAKAQEMASQPPTPSPTPSPTPLVVRDLEKEESIDFSAIRDVLKSDQLQETLIEKQKQALLLKQKEEEQKAREWFFPKEEEFWSFMSLWWMVQEAPLLGWNSDRADLGLADALETIFKSKGIHLGKKYKIFVLDNAEVPHMALPSDSAEFIFLISYPFMRDADLSLKEISCLILENYLRVQKKFFLNSVSDKDLQSLFGQSFYGKEEGMKVELLKKVGQNYRSFIFEKGFDFQQQYEVTREMAKLIQDDEQLMKSYKGLLEKLQALLKGDERYKYKYYNRLYPSPEVQLGWLSPDKRLKK